jgi:hypothetical protein
VSYFFGFYFPYTSHIWNGLAVSEYNICVTFLQKKQNNNTNGPCTVSDTSYDIPRRTAFYMYRVPILDSISNLIYPSRKAFKSDIFFVFSSSFLDLFDLVEEVGQNFYEFMQISQVNDILRSSVNTVASKSGTV